MSEIVINGANLGNSLQSFLMADEILPGTMPSYETCKIISLYHPLGQKMVEAPIKLAQSQKRDISVPSGPETVVRDAFLAEWKALGCDKAIFNVKRQSRIYGVATMALVVDGMTGADPVDYTKLPGLRIRFTTFDPLNTAGSLVLSQDPESFDFQRPAQVKVAGKPYHQSRVVVVMNGDPIYLAYQSSAFGYVGTSVYLRALYPLKSFVNTMVTDDMVALKAGVLIAKQKEQGSIINQAMSVINAVKRQFVKEARNKNVISIGVDEEIETLNLQNIDGAAENARSNILKNIATAADMPAVLLENETMVEGFGEGTEDAKMIAGYVDGFREELAPLYDFCDRVTMYRAWTPEFYKTLVRRFPKAYAGISYTRAFQEWEAAFHAEWPSLLREPESELVKVEEIKLKNISATMQVMLPELSPINKSAVLIWAQDNMNENKRLFATPLQLDMDDQLDWDEQEAERGQALEATGSPGGDQEPKQPKPWSSATG